MNRDEIQNQIQQRWSSVSCERSDGSLNVKIDSDYNALVGISGWLFRELDFAFSGLSVEECEKEWRLHYGFYGSRESGRVEILVLAPLTRRTFPSISAQVCAADWHEREAEDLFGLVFEGHPRLGDFILHDDAWQEGVNPMRHDFSAHTPVEKRHPNPNWQPQRLVEAPGVFLMPIGPVFSGVTESVHFLLETVGEEVIRAIPRLFYQYRGIEKIAEGQTVANALLLAERFSATTAFSHALAFCLAVERICDVKIPERARILRVFIAELERLRHHIAAIEAICESTALTVAANQMSILEEDLLRASGALAEHRYLFGLAVPGGLATDLSDEACQQTLKECRRVLEHLNQLYRMLQFSSSFLDRLEEAGLISEDEARNYGLVGPVARASGISRDLRKVLPYCAYENLEFEVPIEQECDGYARLRILFKEARESVRIMEQVAASLTANAMPVKAKFTPQPGEALGWVEAPRGAAFHRVRLHDDGTIARYHIMPPSFSNWHGFHLSVENFTFQDFPIILATMNLSVAENDR